jgi:hypothetical protein
MKAEKFNSLSKEEQDLEIKRCQESFVYFYNNYCKKDGMPEYTEDVFKEYLQSVEDRRNRVDRRRLRYSSFLTFFGEK